ncbi:hypothetical protein ACOMHN_017490 [Nucella lapillus]
MGSCAVAAGWSALGVARGNIGRGDGVFDPDPRTRHTVWGLMVGGAVTTISLYGINQTIVQRYLAVHKLRHAQATVYMNLPATFLSITLFVVLGLVAYARYYQCDPLLTGRIQSFDQLIPLMVMEVLGKYPGLPGLLVACVFSASLSTVSSGVNALALVYLEDEVKPLYQLIKKKPLTEQQALVVTKVLGKTSRLFAASVCLAIAASVCLAIAASVCLAIAASVCLDIAASVCLAIAASVFLTIAASVCLAIAASVCLAIAASVCLAIAASVCLAIAASVCLAIAASVFLTIAASVCLAIAASVCLAIAASVSVLFGLVTIGLAYVTGLMDQTLVTITIKAQGMTGGPLLGLFFLAMFCPSANSWGAGVGLLCGLAFSFWLGVGAILHGPPAPILPLTPINCSAAMTSQMVTAAEGGATDVTSTWGTSDVTTTLATVMSSLGSTTVTSSANTSAAASPRSRSSSTYDGLTLYELSYLWYAVVSALLVVIIGLLVSLITGCGEQKPINPDHIIPLWQMFKDCVLRQKKRYDVWRSPKAEKYDLSKEKNDTAAVPENL